MGESAGVALDRSSAGAERPNEHDLAESLGASRWAPWVLGCSVTLFAFALNLWGLSEAGYGNTYYSAAARSMSESWRNFFFGALDPGGYITIDKPPLFLWPGALLTRVFGYAEWTVLLPGVVAASTAVGLLWLVVRRWFGLLAGTVAGLALALSPIAVSVNRLNTPEPWLALMLIAAAGALLRSTGSDRWWAWSGLAGALVGLAFNTKMMAAWLPGPAFALALLVAMPDLSRATVKRTVSALAILLAVNVAVSGSWLATTEAWPEDDRPYIGGSENNSALGLALDYNGLGRVEGGEQGVPSFVDTGTGPLRMLDDENGGQIAWLLPFAVAGGFIAAWSWRQDPGRRAFAALFLGWLLLCGAVFSFAEGIYHSYYTAMMAPAVAALIGAGLAGMARETSRDRRWLVASVAVTVATIALQIEIAERTPEFHGWAWPVGAATVAIGLGAWLALVATERAPAAGIAVAAAGLLLVPAVWSFAEAESDPGDPIFPQAGPGQRTELFASADVDELRSGLAEWLRGNKEPGSKWDVVSQSGWTGSVLMAEHGVAVLPLGGFSGQDDTATVAEFAEIVESRDVRYVLVRTVTRTGGPDRSAVAPTGPDAVFASVVDACTLVDDPAVPEQYHRILYDCGGAGDTLRGLGR